MKSDLISRDEAIDAMANALWHYPNDGYRNLNEYKFARGLAEFGLKSVPSAEPDDGDGRWMKMSDADGFYYCCSKCGEELPRYLLSKQTYANPFSEKESIDRTRFCPNCGARMEW